MTTNQESIKIKTLNKRHPTKQKGVYYREIQKTTIDSKGKIKTSIIDKIYSVQYKDIDDKWKFKTLGKYSEGIRESYCSTINELMNHANIEMTMRYAKLAPDNGRVAIQGLYR